MRTFIGLPFTWLPNRVRPDQVIVPFVPTFAGGSCRLVGIKWIVLYPIALVAILYAFARFLVLIANSRGS
jgi:hypothetical protein